MTNVAGSGKKGAPDRVSAERLLRELAERSDIACWVECQGNLGTLVRLGDDAAALRARKCRVTAACKPRDSQVHVRYTTASVMVTSTVQRVANAAQE